MREEYSRVFVFISLPGITPAHAGRIKAFKSSFLVVWDHPRACGKNSAKTVWLSKCGGSPPRMREECYSEPRHWSTPRITPAHAGRISTTLSKHNLARDHPRACGKNLTIRICRQRAVGSPPRMREECLIMYKRSLIFRITPAHAGRMIRFMPCFSRL